MAFAVRFFGAKGDIMLLLPIAAGINGGRNRGALVGFLTGLTLDLVVHGTPTGFFALGYTLVGYIVGMAQAGVLRAAWWIPVLTTLGGSVLGVFAFGETLTMRKRVGLVVAVAALGLFAVS